MTGALSLAAPALLAAKGEAAKAGPIGLAIIIALGIVCYFLFKSMSKHMRRVREEFPVDEPAERPASPSAQPTSTAPVSPPASPSASSPADPES